MSIKLTQFDASEYLNTEKDIAEYLSAILEENDYTLLLSAIGDIAKARGMGKIALESGLGRESLYKALDANSNPRFDTVLRVLSALGVNMQFTPSTTRKRKIRSRKLLSIKSA